LLVESLNLVDFIVEVVIHFGDGTELEVPLLSEVFVGVHNESEFSLLFHATTYFSSHLLLVVLLLPVNAVPCLIFDSFSGLLELLDHMLNLPG